MSSEDGAGQATARGRRAADMLPLSVEGLIIEREGRRLLDGADLTIAADGVTLIMGPNGAGKTLLIRVLHGLESATSGNISWGGASSSTGPSTGPSTELRKRQAMVFQRPVLLRRSVAANVDFVLRLVGERSQERRQALLSDVGLDGFEETPARLLSGGEQQRLALARALASRPDVLFLDEPTTNLDPASTAIIEDIVKAQDRAGTKIIFVTHDIAQARRLADDVVFLHRGRAVEAGPARDFFAEPKSAAARDYLAGRIVV